ncbi:MAG: hypothetical protein ABI790_07870 [Betaproteobacteria bacterium]
MKWKSNESLAARDRNSRNRMPTNAVVPAQAGIQQLSSSDTRHPPPAFIGIDGD